MCWASSCPGSQPLFETLGGAQMELYLLEDTFQLMLSFIPIGFSLGFLLILLGLAVSGVVKIIKRV